jgi:hypothetical protein
MKNERKKECERVGEGREVEGERGERERKEEGVK